MRSSAISVVGVASTTWRAAAYSISEPSVSSAAARNDSAGTNRTTNSGLSASERQYCFDASASTWVRSWTTWRRRWWAASSSSSVGGGVEVGVERHLGVDDDAAPADQVDHEVGPAGAVVEAHLLGEVAPVDEAGQLDRPAQVQLAPAPAHLGLAQRRRQRAGLALEQVDLGVELALPGRPRAVEVVHLVAEPVQPLHHLGLVDQAGDVRLP